MQLFPDADLINVPNVILIVFSTLIALVIIHCVSIPFESGE